MANSVDYRPGDTVNGYVLGADNVWHPTFAPTAFETAAPPKKGGKAVKWAASVVGVFLALGTVGAIVGGEPTSAKEEADAPAAAQQAPEPEPIVAPTVTVTGIVDGDTIDTTEGPVRVIGIDTPEVGACGYGEAAANAAAIVPVGSVVTLTPVDGKDDTDRYDRLIRYVTAADGTDLGMAQIASGHAVARYDSRDGYGAHPQEQAYISADEAAADFTCPVAAVPQQPAAEVPQQRTQAAPAPVPTPAQTVAPVPTTPAPPASVFYANCAAARAAGAAPLHTGDPGYSTKLDRDRDGIACE